MIVAKKTKVTWVDVSKNLGGRETDESRWWRHDDDVVMAALTSTHSSWLWRQRQQELRLDNQAAPLTHVLRQMNNYDDDDDDNNNNNNNNNNRNKKNCKCKEKLL